MKIAIASEYKNLSENYNLWANAEKSINWRKDFYEATRCTVAFAATELKRFLDRILIGYEVVYSDEATGDINIILKANELEGKNCEYEIIPEGNDISIIGKTRVGVLYGAYELLKLQGYRWLSPDTAGGTHIPEATDKFIKPKEYKYYAPEMDVGRGFDFEGFLPGEHMWIWMARNQLNVARPQPDFEAMQNKLGIILKDGGHFFHSIIGPDCVLPDGTTVWESKKEWYGKREDGTELTKQNCMEIQFCFSNEELCNYICDEIIRRLKNEWYHTERLDIWGFDTWGNTCCCDECKKLGNSSDRTLHFQSVLRDRINKANLDRMVELVFCSYGGTCTLEAPKNDIPQNLIDAGDVVVFYAITRCYRHRFDDEGCAENKYLYDCVKGWLDKKPAMPIVMGEYYNLSKWEEMPVVISDTMIYDIPLYIKMGIRGITYMHVPVSDWGVKALTQHIYSHLSFDSSEDAAILLDDYFEHRYHENADAMKQVYALFQEAYRDIQFWRSWSPESVLSQLQVWNGAVPSRPLAFDNHYPNHYADNEEMIATGKEDIEKLKKAAEIISQLKLKYFDELEDVAEIPLALNPAQLGTLNSFNMDDFNLGEVLRILNYGIDSTTLLIYITEYYCALYNRDFKRADNAWETVVSAYRKLDGYFTCISNGFAYYGGTCPSGLKRTQLEAVVRRAASYRKNHLEELK